LCSEKKVVIGVIFVTAGILAVVTAVLVTPGVLATRFTSDGTLPPSVVFHIQRLRLLTGAVGLVTGLVGMGFLLRFGFLLRWWDAIVPRVQTLRKHPQAWMLVLLVVVLIGVGIRCYFYVGLVRPDSFWTTASAHSLLQGGDYFEYSTYYGRSRRVLIYGTWLMFKLFGESDISASLLPLLFSIGTILLVFFIGRKLWTTGIGLLAAGIYATAPPDIAISSFLLPDPIMPFFIALSVLLFLLGREEEGKRRPTWFLLAGATIAFSFYVRENGPAAIGIFVLNWVLFDRRRWRDYMWILAGFAFSLPVVVASVWEDAALFFERVFVNNPTLNLEERLTQVSLLAHNSFTKILVTSRLHAPIYIPAFGVFIYWLLCRCCRGGKQRKPLWEPMVFTWLAWLLFYLEILAPHLHGYRQLPRYTSILLPPSVLALAWGIVKFRILVCTHKAESHWTKIVTWTILICYIIVLLCIPYGPLKNTQTQYYNVTYYWKVPAEFLGRQEAKPIYFLGENTWDKKMEFFLHYRWPDVPYYVGKEIYLGVKDKYLPLVRSLTNDFLSWYDTYVLDNVADSTSLARSLYSIEDAYVLVNPNTFTKAGLDYLIPEDWAIVKRFQDIHNWRERDRILYEAPKRNLPAVSEAWIEKGLQLAEEGRLDDSLRSLRTAILLDPSNEKARALHEKIRLRLYALEAESDELNIALLRTGTQIEQVEGEIPNYLYGVAEAVTLPRDNRWSSSHYLYFDGESELPILLTLNFGQSRRVHCVAIRWKNDPSITGSSWKILYDPGDGSWNLLDEVRAKENAPYELLLSEPLEMQRLKVMITSVNESESAKGIKIERIIVY